MTIREMLTLLKQTIVNRFPVLLSGAPGVGKSDVIAQACREVGASMILSHPAVDDPTDAKGLPWVVDGRATFLPFNQLYKAINADRPTVWLLDDLGQAMPSVQSSYMQLILARCVNAHVLSDNVTFIGATNRRGDQAGVSGILEPVKSRFTTIVELEPDITSWAEWALDNDVPPVEIAFLRQRPVLLSAFAPSKDLTNSPTPRTWANAAKILKLDLPASVRHAALAGAVGEGAASELLAYMKIYAELANVDQILLSPTTAPLPKGPSNMHAVCVALAYNANVGNFDRIAQYVTRLMKDHGEFAALCVRDAVRRNPEVTQTKGYVRLAVGEFGQLVSGSTR